MPKATTRKLPYGSRNKFDKNAMKLLRDTPREYVREKFLPHLDAYCDVIVGLMKQGDRTGIRSYEGALRISDANDQIIELLLGRLGIESESVLERLASRHKEAEAVDEAGLWRLAESFAMDYRRRNGLPLLVEGKPIEQGVL